MDADRVAALLPDYELDEMIGRGATGVVFGARHRRLDREVAIKVLEPALSARSSIRERFLVEARTVAALDHPHIVPVYDYVENDDVCLLVLERMTTETLHDRRPLDEVRSCAVMMAVGLALEHAHGQGVLHRDVKPSNVLFTRSGVPKLADFGIARSVSSDSLRTTTGVLLGTAAYMAPEQITGGELSATTDIYACGVMMYELLGGTLPFAGNDITVLYKQVHEEAEYLSAVEPTVSAGIADVVMAAMAKSPGDRPQSARHFVEAIRSEARQSHGRDWLEASGVPVHESPAALAAISDPPAPPVLSAVEVPSQRYGRPLVSRPVVVLVALVAVAGIGAATVVALRDDGGNGAVTSTSSPEPEPDADAAVALDAAEVASTSVGTGPRAVAVTDGSVWVVSREADEVTRLDPGTLETEVRIAVGDEPSSIAVSDGTVWVASESGSLAGIDVTTDTVTAVVEGMNTPVAIAAGEGSVWVSALGDEALFRVDPDTAEIAQVIPLESFASDVATGEGAIWAVIANGDLLLRMDGSGEIGAMVDTAPAPVAVAVGHGSVWVTSEGARTLTRFDPVDLTVQATIPVGSGPHQITVAADAVWVVNAFDASISVVDPATNTVTDGLGIGEEPTDLALGEGAAWVVDYREHTLTRIAVGD